MKIKTNQSLYNLICMLPDKSNLKNVISNTLDNIETLDLFNHIIPFSISLPIENYINNLYYVFFNEKSKALDMLSIIKAQLIKQYVCPSNLSEKEYIDTLFKIDTQENIWFLCLLNGELNYYYYLKNNNKSQWTLISNHEYDYLKGLETESIEKNFSVKADMISNKNKYREQIENFKELIDLKETSIEKQNKVVKNLQNENQILKGKMKLIGKSILVVGVKWNKLSIDELIIEYKLDRLECLSDMGKNDITPKVLNKDIVIFSTRQAQHDIYNIVKKSSDVFYHTDKINAKTIFDELILIIDG